MLNWAFVRLAGDANWEAREAWIKHAFASQRDARLRAMINLAKGEPRARIEPDTLDGDLWLLGCPNGTLDLRTGKLGAARREDFITKQIAVPFDRAATCSRWREFLDWAMQGDSDLVEFLQTFAGYALTGEVSEEKMCALVGDGANGKSTFLMALYELWGDYAGKARSDLLVNAQGKEGAPSPDVAALHGKRLVIVSETEDGCYLSEARIKDIVSNEIVTARRLSSRPVYVPPDTQNHFGDKLPASREGNGLRHLATARDRSFRRGNRRRSQGRRLPREGPSTGAARHFELGHRWAHEMEARRAAPSRVSALGDRRVPLRHGYRRAMDRRED